MLIYVQFFFFNETGTAYIYTLSLHDALPIFPRTPGNNVYVGFMVWSNFTATKCRGLVSLNQVIKEIICLGKDRKSGSAGMPRPISYAVFCLKKIIIFINIQIDINNITCFWTS